MSYNRDAAAPYRVRTNIDELTQLGVKLPKPVTDARAALDAIPKPIQPDTGAMAMAVLDGANADELHRLALAELAFEKVRDAHGRATLIAADNAAQQLYGSYREVHKQLAALADKAIAKLTHAAEIDVPLDALVRAGRHADAEAVAVADASAANLNRLYSTRERIYWPRNRYPVAETTRWTEPEFAGRDYLDGLRAGGTLWFPTFAEACERANELQASTRSTEEAVLADA